MRPTTLRRMTHAPYKPRETRNVFPYPLISAFLKRTVKRKIFFSWE
jgi:hypothetical protein